jgi:hypothetical protein
MARTAALLSRFRGPGSRIPVLDSQSLRAPFQRRSRALVIGFTAVVLLAVSILEGADLWWGHQRSLQVAEKRATNLSLVLAEYIRGSFAVADTSLRQLAMHGSRVGGASADSSAWEVILGSARAAMPADATGSISVADANGIIRPKPVEPDDLLGTVATLLITVDAK